MRIEVYASDSSGQVHQGDDKAARTTAEIERIRRAEFAIKVCLDKLQYFVDVSFPSGEKLFFRIGG